jgi:hypothetical protein
MLLHLAGGIQAAAGVVQVDLVLTVEPGELRGPQLVQGQGGGVVRESGQEIVVRITPQATRGPELPVGWVV